MLNTFFGSPEQPISFDELELGGFRLYRVAIDDPALGGAIDSRWDHEELFVLLPVRDVAPWERRVATELGGVLAEAIGTGRTVELAGIPTPVRRHSVAPTASEPETSATELVAWLRASRDPDGIVALASPMGGIDRVRITTHAASPEEIDQLAAALRGTLSIELPADYLAILYVLGGVSVETTDGRLIGMLLTPAAVRLRVVSEDEDAVVPFYVDEHELVLAFDPANDPPIVVRFGDRVGASTGLTFRAWLHRWRACLGVELLATLPEVELPPGAAEILRQKKLIEAWVRPMYEAWDAQH
jgi:hypothetical protein